MIGFISTMVVTATMVVLVAVDPFRDHMPTQVCSLDTLASLVLHTATPCALAMVELLLSITYLDHPTQDIGKMPKGQCIHTEALAERRLPCYCIKSLFATKGKPQHAYADCCRAH